MLEDAGILRCSEERCDEDQDRLRLDGRAVVRVEEVEEEVHVDLAAKENSRWWVQEEQTLQIRQRSQNEHIIDTVCLLLAKSQV